jgi:predicted metal-dependent hydrolase
MNSSVYPTTTASSADYTIVPRKVQFDWSASPLHWLPDDPLASHMVNEFSYLLQAGELFFCRVFNQALPLVTDEKLREDVHAFIRQEAIHSRAHKISIDQYLSAHGIDLQRTEAFSSWLFSQLLAEKPLGVTLPKALARQWLTLRVGMVAAVEHYTCALGVFVLQAREWEQNGADPVVADLFRWHGAEEIEHRTVAFDLYRHLGGSLPTRTALMAGVMPGLLLLMGAGTTELIKRDASYPGARAGMLDPRFWRSWRRTARAGNMVSPGWFLRHGLRFMSPRYNPLHEASTEAALAYIHASAGVLAAH